MYEYINIIFPLYFLVIGLIIGSFLNVVLYRFNTGRGIMGRSHCMSCNRTLGWQDLVPVLSFLFLGGKCRTCKSSISWQYMAVELLTGILFLAVYFKYAPLLWFAPSAFSLIMIYNCAIAALLVLIVVYDIRHRIIPDLFVYAFALIALAHDFIIFVPYGILLAPHAGGIVQNSMGALAFIVPSGWVMLAGPLLAFPFYLIWVFSDGKWMGLGDAKLALGIGWYLGLSYGATAIIFGFWIGAAVSIAVMLAYRSVRGLARKETSFFGLSLPRLKMKSEIPFAPFLIAGLLTVFVSGYTLFGNLM